MSEKYIVRLPCGDESLPFAITQKGFRCDVGIAFMDWKRSQSNLKGKREEFKLFSVVDGKKGPLVGRVVFYDPFPVWFDAKGRAYAYKRDGTLADRIPDEVIRRSRTWHIMCATIGPIGSSDRSEPSPRPVGRP